MGLQMATSSRARFFFFFFFFERFGKSVVIIIHIENAWKWFVCVSQSNRLVISHYVAKEKVWVVVVISFSHVVEPIIWMIWRDCIALIEKNNMYIYIFIRFVPCLEYTIGRGDLLRSLCHSMSIPQINWSQSRQKINGL